MSVPAVQLTLQKAIQAFNSDNFDSAVSVLKGVLEGDINSADIIFELGVAYANSNRHKEALAVLSCLRPYKKSDVKLFYNLGLIYDLQGNQELALEAYDTALKIQPNNIEALINKGSICNDIKKYSLAFEVLEKATQIRPDIPEGWSNLGIALNHLNLCQESLSAYCEAIKLNPNYFQAWSNKSVVLNKMGQFREAYLACNRALSLNPDYVDAWCNKGNALNELKRYEEAIAHFDKALHLNPNFSEAWSNKGVSLKQLERYDEAIAHYEKSLSLKSDIDWVHGDLLHTKMKICSWLGLTDSLGDISKQVMANRKIAQPFSLLALNDDIFLHKKSAEIYAQDKYPLNPTLGLIRKHAVKEKIRIGYFSADFKNHPVAFLIAELFEIHNRNQFEIYAFSLENANDEMRGRLVTAFDYFIDAESMSDIEVAQLSREHSIDIAVDLTGFTQDSRTGIFAHRAAPIQVNYLGYPGTMGTDYIDYIIADKTLIPTQSQKFYSEKVIYMPNSYQVNDRRRLISDKQFTRQELGLPGNGFVFCCFNNNFKILPATFAGWMRILKAVDDSVLWLFADNPWAVENLRKEASSHEIDANRLIFAERMSLPEHLARHRQADLFLDTFPYNAHTTTSDALWSGLPVLTLMGETFASRVAASLLNAIDLPELITSTQEEYEIMAIDLAMNPKKLADIKVKLSKNRLTTPLFDTPLFSRNLEATYIKMYEGYRADL
jgi:predicted O-linked N-acetylglucosamine transferase (SPINDLY family)